VRLKGQQQAEDRKTDRVKALEIVLEESLPYPEACEALKVGFELLRKATEHLRRPAHSG
jgi:hypothetical protein